MVDFHTVCNNEIMRLDNHLNFFLRAFFSVLILIENVNHVFWKSCLKS